MASNPSKEKGTRAETDAKTLLRKITGLAWERTPLSGALHEKHGLKSDLYIPNEHNLFAVEIKHYQESHINHLLIVGKSSKLIEWWQQTIRQSSQTGKLPLLIFKHDRSKFFAAFTDLPEEGYPFLTVSRDGHEFFISLLEDYLKFNKPKFIK